MLLARCLHTGKLLLIESGAVDIPPIVRSAVHGETGRNRAVGPNDDIILAGAAIPLSELKLAIVPPDDARNVGKKLDLIAISVGPVSIPAVFRQVETGRHTQEGLDFL